MEDSIYSEANSVINQGINLRENSLLMEVSAVCPASDVKYKQIRAILDLIRSAGNFEAYSDAMFLSSALKNLGDELKKIKGLKKYFECPIEELKQLSVEEVNQDYIKLQKMICLD